MIQIESTMLHALNVPLRLEQGNKSPMITIPPMVNGVPGVLELAELDAVTMARLKWHYMRRPNDGNAKNTAEVDENGEPRFKEIGLLKITITDGAPSKKAVPSAEPAPVEPLHGQRTTAGIGPDKKTTVAASPGKAKASQSTNPSTPSKRSKRSKPSKDN